MISEKFDKYNDNEFVEESEAAKLKNFSIEINHFVLNQFPSKYIITFTNIIRTKSPIFCYLS